MNLKLDLKIIDKSFKVNGNKIYINLIILLFFVILINIMPKIHPQHPQHTIHYNNNTDEEYNYIIGAIWGTCICLCLCILLVLCIHFLVKKDIIFEDGSY